MKLSIIVPVYNEKGAVAQCLNAILNQDYPKDDYEVIVVNDGSSDGTKEVVEKYQVRLINLEANMGRIVARESGAIAAKNEVLLFIDSRHIIQGNDFLKKMAEIGYQPLFPVATEEKYGNPFNTFFYLIRKKWYKPYYPYDDYPREFWIDGANFDSVPKGMSVVLIDRGLFLSSISHEKGKMVNDDTRLLREVVKKTRILRHSDVKARYAQRTGFREVMRHLYERGPRFADYYLAKGCKYRMLYLALLFCSILYILSMIFCWKVFLAGLAMVLIINIATALWFAENIRDFFVAFFLLPPVASSFALGVLKWQIKRNPVCKCWIISALKQFNCSF